MEMSSNCMRLDVLPCQVAALVGFNTQLSYQNHDGICESAQFMRTLLESKVVVGGQCCGSNLCVKMNFYQLLPLLWTRSQGIPDPRDGF